MTYRRVLNETSTLFDYQLRQMALSLRGHITLAPHIEVPPDQGDADFVVCRSGITFGARVYSVATGAAHDQSDGAGVRRPVAAGQPLAGLRTPGRRRRVLQKSRSHSEVREQLGERRCC